MYLKRLKNYALTIGQSFQNILTNIHLNNPELSHFNMDYKKENPLNIKLPNQETSKYGKKISLMLERNVH